MDFNIMSRKVYADLWLAGKNLKETPSQENQFAFYTALEAVKSYERKLDGISFAEADKFYRQSFISIFADIVLPPRVKRLRSALTFVATVAVLLIMLVFVFPLFKRDNRNTELTFSISELKTLQYASTAMSSTLSAIPSSIPQKVAGTLFSSVCASSTN